MSPSVKQLGSDSLATTLAHSLTFRRYLPQQNETMSEIGADKLAEVRERIIEQSSDLKGDGKIGELKGIAANIASTFHRTIVKFGI